jgi:uroporphyrin-III C-methyltransferase/precorrin-2 dehydrogenase/sirohydrochlorin ferrochelatase
MLGRVSLVGAGPGDLDLWTLRARRRVEEADLVLYDALVDADSLRGITRAQCFCVGKRAGRASVKQETINRLMIRAARQGKRVVRLKGGDPFVFGRGAEETLALVHAGIPVEVVPGVTTAVAAPELAGIPVTHRGMASGFVVLTGQTGEGLNRALGSVRPAGLTVVVMMGLADRAAIAGQFIDQGWSPRTPAALVCGASTPDEWVWTGTLQDVGTATPPDGVPGVVVVGNVVSIGEAVTAAQARPADADEVKYGRS